MNVIVPIVRNTEKYLVIIVCMHGGLYLTGRRGTLYPLIPLQATLEDRDPGF